MITTSLFPFLVYLLIHIDLALFFISAYSLSLKARLLAAIGITLFSALPLFSFVSSVDLPLIMYSRAIFGDPGLLILVIVILHLGEQFFPKYGLLKNIRQTELLPLCWGALVLALILYPSALGLFRVDIYSLGYSPVTLSVFFILTSLICIWLRYYVIGLSIAGSMLLFRLEVMDSDNLWDYFIDPLLILYALTFLLNKYCRLLYQQLSSHRDASSIPPK